MMSAKIYIQLGQKIKTLWPSGLRRWLKAPFRKGVGSNPTGVTYGDLWTVMHPSDSLVMIKRCIYMLSAHVSGHAALGAL